MGTGPTDDERGLKDFEPEEILLLSSIMSFEPIEMLLTPSMSKRASTGFVDKLAADGWSSTMSNNASTADIAARRGDRLGYSVFSKRATAYYTNIVLEARILSWLFSYHNHGLGEAPVRYR